MIFRPNRHSKKSYNPDHLLVVVLLESGPALSKQKILDRVNKKLTYTTLMLYNIPVILGFLSDFIKKFGE
jgi:hypothetical protein